jgi:DNA-directed RNA polymerase beta subunit
MSKTEITYDSLPPFAPHLEELTPEKAEEVQQMISKRVFTAYLRSNGIAPYHIESYEKSIEEVYDKVRESKIYLEETRTDTTPYVGFTEPVLEEPSKYPAETFVMQTHYTGKLKAKPYIFNAETGMTYVSKNQITLCELPILVRSKYCKVRRLFDAYEDAQDEHNLAVADPNYKEAMVNTARNLSKAGEALTKVGCDPSDPGKYFIMGGVRRIILTGESLRINQPYVYENSTNFLLASTLWSARPIPSSITIGTKSDTVFISSSSSTIWKNDEENVFTALRILGVHNEAAVHEILGRMLPNVANKNRAVQNQIIRSYLDNSIRQAFSETDEDFFARTFDDTFKSTLYKYSKLDHAAYNRLNTLEAKQEWSQHFLCMNSFTNFPLAGEFLFEGVDDALIQSYGQNDRKQVVARAYTIFYMLIRFCLVRNGFRPQDSRDSWANKRVTITGERFTTQFHHSFMRTTVPDKTAADARSHDVLQIRMRELWARELNKADYLDGSKDVSEMFSLSLTIMTGGTNIAGIDYSSNQAEAMDKESKRKKFTMENKMTTLHSPDSLLPVVLEDFWKAFKKKGWGVFGSGMKTGGSGGSWRPDATDTLNVDQNDLHTNYQLCAITVRSDAQSKTIKPRLVHESQAYLVCPVVTPEGENVGLTKQIAIGTKVSLGRTTQEDTKKFFSLLDIRKAPSSRPMEGNTLLHYWPSNHQSFIRMFYNGCFVGLCDGIAMRKFLNNNRAVGKLWWDTCVYFDTEANLHVGTEANRLLRPVFVMDETTGVPKFMLDKELKVFEKMYLTKKDYDVMVQRGYIVWVDAVEQASGFVAKEDGVYKLIKTVDDIPSSEKNPDNYQTPISAGHLIADSIWDVYHAKTRARIMIVKRELLSKWLEILRTNPERLFVSDIRKAVTEILGEKNTATERQEIRRKISEAIYDHVIKDEANKMDRLGNGKMLYELFGASLSAYSTSLDLDEGAFLNSLKSRVESELKACDSAVIDVIMRSKYTHAAISPSMMFSVAGLIIPYLNHIHGPRANLASKFNQQTLRGRYTNQDLLMPNEVKILNNPTLPLVRTTAADFVGLSDQPTGRNAIVAVGCFEGVNQEDSLVFNRNSIDMGMFNYTRYYSRHLSKESMEDSNIFGSKYYTKPTTKKSSFVFARADRHDNSEKFRHISKVGGLPKPGTMLKAGDCIIAAYEVIEGDKGGMEEIDRSVYVENDGAGIVDKVTVTRNYAGNPVVTVRIRQVLKPVVGDKFASRHAQKCTIGRIEPMENLPRTENGVVPDIIMNPHALPNRMTVGQVIEMVTGKASVLSGESVIADPFEKVNMERITTVLQQHGYSTSGKEIMYDGITGRMFDAKVLIGPCYYQPLKHQVKFKQQSRSATGSLNATTRQPAGGRANDSGIRAGVMEKAILSMVPALEKHQCLVSDAYPTKVCVMCKNPDQPMTVKVNTARGVCQKQVCRSCNNFSVNRFRNFVSYLEVSMDKSYYEILRESFARNIRKDADFNAIASRVTKFQELKVMLETTLGKMDKDVVRKIVIESVRRAYFPMVFVEEAVDSENQTLVDKLSMVLMELWEQFDKEASGKMIKSADRDILRPVKETEWKTVMIPFSTLVAFRYFAQMGYNVGLKSETM